MTKKNKETQDRAMHFILLSFQDEIKEDILELKTHVIKSTAAQTSFNNDLDSFSSTFYNHMKEDEKIYGFLKDIKEDAQENKTDVKQDLYNIRNEQTLIKVDLGVFSKLFAGHMKEDEKIYYSLIEIKEMLAKNSVILDANVEDIKLHIKRTDMLEELLEKKTRPISLMYAIKISGMVFAGIAALLGIIRFFK